MTVSYDRPEYVEAADDVLSLQEMPADSEDVQAHFGPEDPAPVSTLSVHRDCTFF